MGERRLAAAREVCKLFVDGFVGEVLGVTLRLIGRVEHSPMLRRPQHYAPPVGVGHLVDRADTRNGLLERYLGEDRDVAIAIGESVELDVDGVAYDAAGTVRTD